MLMRVERFSHRRSRRSDAPPRQRGQAMVEVAVALLALVPLLLGIVLVAKYQDLQRAAVAASRLVAFECTVRIDACTPGRVRPELLDEARQRVFGPARAPIRSAIDSRSVAESPAGDPFWADRAGRPLVERLSDVSLEIRNQHFTSPLSLAAGLGERTFPGAVQLVSELGGPGRFGLALEGGLVDARVTLQVARSAPDGGAVPRSLLALPLRLSARAAVLTDAWTASGPRGAGSDTVEARVFAGARLPLLEPALDAGYLPIRGLLSLAGAVGLEPSAGRFRHRWVDVDRVPPDRLSSAGVNTQQEGSPLWMQ
jgi:hypothetical protein